MHDEEKALNSAKLPLFAAFVVESLSMELYSSSLVCYPLRQCISGFTSIQTMSLYKGFCVVGLFVRFGPFFMFCFFIGEEKKEKKMKFICFFSFWGLTPPMLN